MRPKVSIITSIYNGDKYISHFLSSITTQTYFSKCELILIDANSPQNEKEVIVKYLKKYSNIIYRRLESDPGIYECWNIAIRMARGDYVTNANLDDIRLPVHIEKCVEVLEENSSADVVSTSVFVIPEKESFKISKLSEYEVWFEHIPDVYFSRHLFEKTGEMGNNVKSRNIPHCCPVWRKSVHDKIGYFDEEKYKYAADWEFWLRAATNNCGFRHIKSPLAVYRVVENSHNRKFRKLYQNISKMIVDEYYQKSVNFSLNNVFDFNSQLEGSYGKHRSGWSWVMDGFRSFEDDEHGIILSSFIERDFGWGYDIELIKKMKSRGWVGIAHAPHNYPKFIADIVNQKPEYYVNESPYRSVWESCLGMFTLSDYLAEEWRRLLPGVQVESLVHPTETPLNKFTLEKFENNNSKKIIQIGYWLRKLTSILKLQTTSDLKRVIISPDISIPHIKDLWVSCRKHEMNSTNQEFEMDSVSLSLKLRKFNDICRFHGVEPIKQVSNNSYDDYLSKNIVFLDVYDMSASNLIVECIVRNTPILVKKHSAVIEYLGVDYPFYFETLEEASEKLKNKDNIKATYQYLALLDKGKFTRNYFVKSVYDSDLYKTLISNKIK